MSEQHFSVGDKVRVKRGVADINYPDFPLGGWTGTVLEVATEPAGTCLVRWTPATLAAAHPAYHVRCERDNTDPETYRWDSDEKYYNYLKAKLRFPFAARCIDESVPSEERVRAITVIQMFEEFPTDECYEAMCQVWEKDNLREMPLAELDVLEEAPNFQIIDDYSYWLHNAEEEFSGDFAEQCDLTDDEDYDNAVDFAGGAFRERDDLDDEESPPNLVNRSRTGRNDPCPCGSGKKFKKCCLKKQPPPEPETPKAPIFGRGKSTGAMLPLRPTPPALTETAYQIKVTLLNSDLPIWRRFRVKDCNLATLHHVVQIVMSWHDDHLHCFEVGSNTYGDTSRSSYGSSMKDAKLMTLGRIVQRELPGFIYEYDFGDSWRHDVVIEQTLPITEGDTYPLCLEGQRACPPEDSGGIWGYQEQLETLLDPAHKDHEETLGWFGDDFDPETFNTEKVNQRLASLRQHLDTM